MFFFLSNVLKESRVSVGVYHIHVQLIIERLIKCFGSDEHYQSNGGKDLFPQTGKAFLEVEVHEKKTCGISSGGAIECIWENRSDSKHLQNPQWPSKGRRFVHFSLGSERMCGIADLGNIECICFEDSKIVECANLKVTAPPPGEKKGVIFPHSRTFI